MSEDLVLPPSKEATDSITTPLEEEVKSESAIAPKAAREEVDDDLEDGEIDDDDDNDEPIEAADSKIVGAAPSAPIGLAANIANKPQVSPPNMVSVLEIMNEKKPKSKKHHIVEDDFAGSIESAIAAALKKDGIMPPKPKILESREDIDKQSDKEVMQSKSSRRRKRRKLRDEREKEREKKKHRTSSPDTTLAALAAAAAADEELDDDEMLCVRGGSPPPSGLLPSFAPLEPNMSSKKEGYDSDDSYSSYDSYDSTHNYGRYSSSRKKDANTGSSGSRSKRKERSSSRREDERRLEKRSRRNYDDSGGEDKYQDRHPQQPRKLELCKFYLMECCAKKDKCSYMHSDFPCKYYYLGMECVYRSACKFSHGKPLTDQLRSVLLKHLETAPKEILGTFRRISRENALNLMNATHEKICEEHGVENTLSPPTMTTQSVVQSQAGAMRNGDLQLQQQHHHQQHQQQQQHQQHQQHQQQQQQQQQQQLQQQTQAEIIPSLLDMVINIPPATSDASTPLTTTAGTVATGGGQNTNKSDKQRKSRWCDSAATNIVVPKQNNLEPPSSSAPSYLDLKNLTGILSTDRIEKLSQFGVVNLEQINQLTLSQLNNIGLTVTEISEIQLNARNMARLGVVGVHGEPVSANLSNTTTTVATSASLPSSQDVDMRFLPSCLPLTTTTITTSTVTSEKSINDLALSSPDPKSLPTGMVGITAASNLQDSHSSSVGGIDYSQYLRDSNLVYDKNDPLDDEKDEEQLVIDDQDLDALDDNSQLNETETKNESENDSKGSPSFSYGGGDSNDSRLPPPIQLSDKLQNLLKDPTNLYTVNVSALLKNNDALSGKLMADCIRAPYDDDDGFYGAGASNNRRDTDTRDEYRDPRLTDNREEYRDPRDTKDEYRYPRLSSKLSEAGRAPFSYRPPNSEDDSDRSRSQSPMPSLAEQMENFVPLYERQSMYDWTPKCIQEDIEYNKRHKKADKDMRLSRFLDSSNSDIDLRLPFQPVKNMQIAKEIDASMSTLMPILYKITEIDVPEPKYSDLRHSFQCDDSTDPRLRRILGLPELSNSKVLAALGRPSRPTIASPSSVESSSSPTREKERPSTSVVRGPRIDPRRAAATATVTSAGAAQNPPVPAGNPHQNVEIRMLLQKSEWYKNLNSQYKIMVNQQLALVSTELKRFHQDPSPNKVFDIQFIVSNQSLQQILTNLGIYIDDNGQVAHLENDNNDMMGGMGPGMDYGPGGGANQMMMMNDPNMSIQQRMTMQQQMEFLRGPPPNMNMMRLGGNGPMGPGGPGPQQGMFCAPGGMMPPFGRNSRLGILGMPPGAGGGGGFNPFGGNPGDNGGGMMDPNYCGPQNPFANNFGSNGGNFGGQQMNRGNRNNFNRQGGGPGGGMNNGGNRMNQNRRGFKNNTRDRRGGGNSNSTLAGGGGGPGSSGSGGGGGGGPGPSGVGNQNANGGDVEESWDNDA